MGIKDFVSYGSGIYHTDWKSIIRNDTGSLSYRVSKLRFFHHKTFLNLK